MLASSLLQSLKPRAVRTRIFFLRALNSSRFRIWCLEFSSFGFVSNFGSFDIAQDTFRASSLFILFLGVPVDAARGHALRKMFSSNPRPRREGMGEGRQPSNYPCRLLPQRGKWTIMADGKGGSPTARHAHAVHRTLFTGPESALTGPLFSKLLDGVQIHNPVACGSAPPL